MRRNFIQKKRPSLLAVVHQAVLNAPSGLDAYDIAPLAGYEGSSAYAVMMAELTQEGRKCDMDRLLPIMDATDSDAPLHFLARHRGGVFIRIPCPAQRNADLVRSLADTIKNFGDYAADAADAIADGIVDSAELERIEADSSRVIEAVEAMRCLARATHDKQSGGEK